WRALDPQGPCITFWAGGGGGAPPGGPRTDRGGRHPALRPPKQTFGQGQVDTTHLRGPCQIELQKNHRPRWKRRSGTNVLDRNLVMVDSGENLEIRGQCCQSA